MKEKKINITVTDIVLLLITAAYLILLQTVFKECGPKDDGSFMACHWAGRAIFAFGIVLTVSSVAHTLLPSKDTKLGLSISILVTSIVAFFIPGTLIKICGMETMKCHTHTKPANTVFAILTAVAALADIVLYIINSRKTNK